MVPTGAESEVAVVIMTLLHMAHREERASPRNPKVRTVVKSAKEDNLEVWCFRAIIYMHAKHVSKRLET
jgi:hypothetical protein